MIKNYTLICLIWFVVGCTKSTYTNSKDEIIKTDIAFSNMSKEKGVREAFIAFADEHVIKPNPNQQPIVGKEALIKSFDGKNQDFELTWEPIKAESGDSLGYTFGNFYLKTHTPDMRDTVLYGNYVSIWKKQKDGSWKYVLDTGNPTPEPTKLE